MVLSVPDPFYAENGLGCGTICKLTDLIEDNKF